VVRSSYQRTSFLLLRTQHDLSNFWLQLYMLSFPRLHSG